ncbi:MAG: aminoglycoside phosphotransferase family protein [Holophaga sp.]
MSAPAAPDPRAVARDFCLEGELRGVQPYGDGHINATFLVTTATRTSERRFILQRINTSVFREPLALMENLVRITRHLHLKLEAEGVVDLERRALRLVAATDGSDFVMDGAGGCWRCFPFIEGTREVSVLAGPHQAFEAGRAFGDFQRLLADLPGPALSPTIPHFHDAEFRFHAFSAAMDADVLNRACQAVPEIRFALSQRDLAGFFGAFIQRGEMQPRITHNDTKLNNLLFDAVTDQVVCVLDLDTVMPGLALYDFGDLARSAACAAPEDELRLDKVHADPAIFAELARGFLQGSGAGLNGVERDNLVGAAQVITYSLGLRFLADFLEGDRYFRIHREGHNLDRARTQFALLRDLQEREPELRRSVEAIS